MWHIRSRCMFYRGELFPGNWERKKFGSTAVDIFRAGGNACSVKDDAGACSEAEAPWRCIFSRRTALCTPSRFRKEMRVFLERFLPIAKHRSYGWTCPFLRVFPRIYIRMVPAFPDVAIGHVGKKRKRRLEGATEMPLQRSSTSDRANFPTERTPKTF